MLTFLLSNQVSKLKEKEKDVVACEVFKWEFTNTDIKIEKINSALTYRLKYNCIVTGLKNIYHIPGEGSCITASFCEF